MLHIEEETNGDCTVFHLEGELDVFSRRELLDSATAAIQPPHDCHELVVIDIERLEFCDAAGVNTLAQVCLLAGISGHETLIDEPSRQVRRIADVLAIDLPFAS